MLSRDIRVTEPVLPSRAKRTEPVGELVKAVRIIVSAASEETALGALGFQSAFSDFLGGRVLPPNPHTGVGWRAQAFHSAEGKELGQDTDTGLVVLVPRSLIDACVLTFLLAGA